MTLHTIIAFHFRGGSAISSPNYLSSSGTTSLWTQINLTLNYSRIAIFFVALITQLLALFGTATDTNVLVWTYGAGYLAGIVTMIYVAVEFYVYDTAIAGGKAEDLALAATVRKELIFIGLVEVFAGSTLQFHERSWKQSYIESKESNDSNERSSENETVE